MAGPGGDGFFNALGLALAFGSGVAYIWGRGASGLCHEGTRHRRRRRSTGPRTESLSATCRVTEPHSALTVLAAAVNPFDWQILNPLNGLFAYALARPPAGAWAYFPSSAATWFLSWLLVFQVCTMHS